MNQILIALVIASTLYLYMISQTDELKDEWVHSVTDYLIPGE